MTAKLRLLTMMALVSLCPAGCAPKNIFRCCDRYCFLADWTNAHSCINRDCTNANCCEPPIVDCNPECHR
jgi:hypothetical protein